MCEPLLNTVFKHKSTACLTQVVYLRQNDGMHTTMKRLYEAVEQIRGITGQSEVGRLLNMSPQTLNNWEVRGMSKTGMIAAQSIFGCSATWLATGEGAMMLGTTVPGARAIRAADEHDGEFVQIPMVSLRLQAGITGFQTEPDRRDGGTIGMRASWLQRHGYNPSALIAIQVKGDSMEPGLHEGDIVVINTADKKPADGVVFAVNYEGEAVVKRMVRDAGMWWAASDNPDQVKYHRKSCRGDECLIIGRIVRKESDRI